MLTRNTVETAKFGRHFCSDFSAELCSFRTWKILLSSDDMDELLSSDHMNELCNLEKVDAALRGNNKWYLAR